MKRIRTLRLSYCVLVAALGLSSCEDYNDNLSLCPDDSSEVEIVVPESYTSAPVSENVTIRGHLNSELRIRRLTVGRVPVKGDSLNYGNWSVEIPQLVLQDYRGEDSLYAELPIEATDACDNSFTDNVLVRVNAPPATNATGLKLSVHPFVEGECYLPADGSSKATVEIVADASAAGVTVALDSQLDGNFDHALDKTVLLEPDEATQSTRASATFRPKAAGLLAIAASAGTFHDDDKSGLTAVGAPTFVGSEGDIPKDTERLVHVSSAGRLRSCKGFATVAGSVTATYEQNQNLLAGLEFTDEECGVAKTFSVRFDAGAPDGASLTISCEDTYGQSQARTLVAITPEP